MQTYGLSQILWRALVHIAGALAHDFMNEYLPEMQRRFPVRLYGRRSPRQETHQFAYLQAARDLEFFALLFASMRTIGFPELCLTYGY